MQEDEVEDKHLLFFQQLKTSPHFLYFGNSYYFWIFEATNLETIKIWEDKDYREYVSQFFGVGKDQENLI